jgi:hypothetical protein
MGPHSDCCWLNKTTLLLLLLLFIFILGINIQWYRRGQWVT